MSIFSTATRIKRTVFAFLAKPGRSLLILAFLLSPLAGLATAVQAAEEITFTAEELIGRPTASSITINVIPDAEIELFYEYGTVSGAYTGQSALGTAAAGVPYEVVISGLDADTLYYYRMRYHAPGDGAEDWITRAEHTFRTQRAAGEAFSFDISSDAHVNIMLGNVATWRQTIQNIASDNPDFLIDLGDTFAMDSVTTAAAANAAYLYARNPANNLLGSISPSIPIFLAAGNHEQQEGWHLDDTGNPATSLPVLGTNAQKRYYLNPVPDGFYTGNTDTYSYLEGDHLHEDYYAWEWGDVLFVVIDPFWYTTTKPFTGNQGGGESSDTGSGDRWDWTLGQQQFEWFKQTISESNATYKFVFAHHMVGGSDDYVREGAIPAHLFEWGGYNLNGTTWGFNTERPGWGDDPIHQLMIEYDVDAFFHGHDHQYAYEVRDGIVYQSLPSAGFSGNGFNLYNEADPYTEKVLPSPGHLRVSISPEDGKAVVAYVSTTTNTVTFSYDILADTATPNYTLTVSANPSAGGTTSPTAGTHTYSEGSVVDITATPADGYEFVSWDGDCSGTGACQVTMTSDRSVTANFRVESSGILGDINGDDAVNSTDALIILSGDIGISIVQFCPGNCGDVNGDGVLNSTDALIILSHDAGMTIPFPLGQAGMCPVNVTPCAGCNP